MYEDFIKGTADMEHRRDDEAHFSHEVNRAATRRSAATGDDYSDAESHWERRRRNDDGLDPTRAAFSEVSRWRRRRRRRRRRGARREAE